MKNKISKIIGFVLIVLGIFYILQSFFVHKKEATPQNQSQLSKLINTVSYMCDGKKIIDAKYFEGPSKAPAAPDQPPIPGGSVQITLSDGQLISLPQTISADGVRYANSDESFIFWSKGNGVLVLENGQEKSYTGCIEISPNTSGDNLTQIYENGSEGFSIRYPQGYTVNESFQNQLSPDKTISGIQFKIPASVAQGTNLASDSYLSIEKIPNTQNCNASIFLYDNNIKSMSIIDNGTEYSVASTTDAGAGNRYQETIYALPYTNPCIAIHYFIHYSVFENYPAGTVRQFDMQAITNQFDQIRRTVIVNQ
jgi:membrane-bound inhibitor of C-type lysozyme